MLRGPLLSIAYTPLWIAMHTAHESDGLSAALMTAPLAEEDLASTNEFQSVAAHEYVPAA